MWCCFASLVLVRIFVCQPVPVSHHNTPYGTISCHFGVLICLCLSLCQCVPLHGVASSCCTAGPPWPQTSHRSDLVEVVAHAARCDEDLPTAPGLRPPLRPDAQGQQGNMSTYTGGNAATYATSTEPPTHGNSGFLSPHLSLCLARSHRILCFSSICT